jgi:hypothetical protein
MIGGCRTFELRVTLSRPAIRSSFSVSFTLQSPFKLFNAFKILILRERQYPWHCCTSSLLGFLIPLLYHMISLYTLSIFSLNLL